MIHLPSHRPARHFRRHQSVRQVHRNTALLHRLNLLHRIVARIRHYCAGSLTAQEMQIARLVRQGLSNPEIGTRLFLSPRTVEWHLRNVFGKVGIASRRQLRDLDLDAHIVEAPT